MISDASTIAEAKAFIAARAQEGTVCPCCARVVHIRRRPLHAAMAAALVLFEKHAREHGDAYVHGQTLIADAHELSPADRAAVRGDFAKLEHFGLLEQTRAPGKPKSGLWRITHAGREFVAGRLRVRSHFYMFNKQAVVVDDGSTSTISIDEALAGRFDLGALLEA